MDVKGVRTAAIGSGELQLEFGFILPDRLTTNPTLTAMTAPSPHALRGMVGQPAAMDRFAGFPQQFSIVAHLGGSLRSLLEKDVKQARLDWKTAKIVIDAWSRQSSSRKPKTTILGCMRAVLFDLGNTLVSYYATADFVPILRQSLRSCLRVLALHAHVDENTLMQRALALNVERDDHAVWPLLERLGIVFKESSFDPVIQERLASAFLEPIFATAILDRDALAVLAALRAQGFRTAIVSNTPWGSPSPAWRLELVRHGLLAAVDAAVFCTDVGYRKPHPAPIERALSLLGACAAEAVFVGDDPRWDVVGAQRAGVQPILLGSRSAELASNVIPIAANLREVLEVVLGMRPSGPTVAARPV